LKDRAGIKRPNLERIVDRTSTI
jgi:hypothetical protein